MPLEEPIASAEESFRKKAADEKNVLDEAEKSLARVRELTQTISDIKNKIDELESKKRRLTGSIEEIEATIERNYKPKVKMTPAGEKFYYVKLEQEDARYQQQVLGRTKLLTDRIAVDKDLQRLSEELHRLMMEATRTQMEVEERFKVLVSLEAKQLGIEKAVYSGRVGHAAATTKPVKHKAKAKPKKHKAKPKKHKVHKVKHHRAKHVKHKATKHRKVHHKAAKHKKRRK